MRFQAQASVYLEALSALDSSVLHNSARLWIRRSPFFPKVSELLHIARLVLVQKTDYLANRVQLLEDAFYHDRTLAAQAWLDLADEF